MRKHLTLLDPQKHRKVSGARRLFCENRRCTLKKRLYLARNAEDEYTRVLHEARRGFNLCSEELKAIDEFFSKGILQGQSVSHIIASQRNRAPCSESTARRLIHAGAIAVRDLDMIRVCKMKPRRGEKRGVKVDTKCREGRTYEDFQEFRFRHPDAAVVEVDSVIGKRGGKVLLTMMPRNCSFMLVHADFSQERQYGGVCGILVLLAFFAVGGRSVQAHVSGGACRQRHGVLRSARS